MGEQSRGIPRVLHVDSEKDWGGGQNQLLLLCRELVKRGHECHVACTRDSVINKRLPKEVKRCYAPFFNGADPFTVSRILAYCRMNKIEILHAHTGKAHGIAFLVKQISPRLKLIVHRRVPVVPRLSKWNKIKYLSPKVNRYVAISEHIKHVLVDWGIPLSRMTLIPSAIDLAPYAKIDKPAAKAELLKSCGIDASAGVETLVFGTTSRMLPEKGLDVAVKAFAHLDAPHAVLLMAGIGPQFQRIKQLIRALGLEKKVKLLGFKENMPAFYAGLDVFLMPSRSEGLGSSVLDGFAAGCAVVASSVEGLVDLIAHEQNGLLLASDNVKIWAEGLQKIVSNRDLRQRLAQAGRRTAEEKYSIQMLADRHTEMYQTLLSDEKKTKPTRSI